MQGALKKGPCHASERCCYTQPFRTTQKASLAKDMFDAQALCTLCTDAGRAMEALEVLLLQASHEPLALSRALCFALGGSGGSAVRTASYVSGQTGTLSISQCPQSSCHP